MTQSVNQPAALADEWFTPGRFVALLALCILAAFPEVVLGSHTFYYRDFGHFGYPLAQYHRECFWRGEIPLWNPYSSCGLPHLAQWNTMCLYPGTLIYLLGPMPWAVGGFSLAHLLLAGAGAYRLAHHWTGNRFAATVGGLAFAFNGFTLHAVMWPNNVAALAWAPWLWLLVERACKEGGRTLLLAALVGAMQMLAGAPEVILFTWAVAVPLALVGVRGSRFKAQGSGEGGRGSDKAVPFPLTPALSPGEREGLGTVSDASSAALANPASDSLATKTEAAPAAPKLDTTPPLPEGEGRGEGEGHARISIASSSTAAQLIPPFTIQPPLFTLALRLAAITGLTFLLSSAQLLPFLDLLRHSHRTAAYDDNLYAMPLSGWANFFVPLFRMTPDKLGVFTHVEQQWTSSYYPGIGVLALAALAVWRRREPRVWLLAAVAVLGVWLAMGQKAFLLDWVKAVCPPLGFIRFPIKYVLLPLMVLPFLAALALAERRSPTRRESSLTPTGREGERQVANEQPSLAFSHCELRAVARGGAVIYLLFLYWIFAEEHAMEVSLRTFDPLLRMCLVLLAVSLLRLMLGTKTLASSMGLRVALLAVFCFDILTHAPRQNPTVITQAYEPDVAKFHTTMPRLGEGRAMISREMEGFMAHAQNTDALNYSIGARRALFANWNLIDGVPKVNGFFSQFPRELSDTWWLLYGLDRPFPEGFADFLGVTRISSSETLFTWTHRTKALPLVTAGQEPIFTTATNTLRELANTGFDPAGNVFLPKELLAVSRATNASAITRATVLSTRWDRESINIEVEANAPVWVVIAQTYYHPWKAFVGGRELPIRRANHAFQAIEVTEGRHAIELRYVDHAFRLGALLSLSTLACVLLIFCWRKRGPLKTNH